MAYGLIVGAKRLNESFNLVAHSVHLPESSNSLTVIMRYNRLITTLAYRPTLMKTRQIAASTQGTDLMMLTHITMSHSYTIYDN